jgi:uncharacterized membrane protein
MAVFYDPATTTLLLLYVGTKNASMMEIGITEVWWFINFSVSCVTLILSAKQNAT